MIETDTATQADLQTGVFLEHQATFTIAHDSKHWVYWVSVPERNDGEHHYIWRIRASKGKEYLGEVQEEIGYVFSTTASEDPDQLDILNNVLPHVWDGTPLPEGFALLFARKCARCHGRLTHPDSIRRGLGPSCAKKLEQSPPNAEPAP